MTEVDGSVFEVIKTVGGISGICTAIFLIYDRFTKHYPVAVIEARPLIEGGANIGHFLFLKNVSDRPILLSWTDGQTDRLKIARDHSARNIMRSLFAGETTIALAPQAATRLPVIKPRMYADVDPENILQLEIRWQFAQPILWRKARSLWVRIRKADFEALVDGYVGQQAGD
jgi:hypothetical protein